MLNYNQIIIKTIFAGEWWNVDTEAVISQALQTGAGPNVSDAYTFNGLPGPLYNCSQNGTSRNVTNSKFGTLPYFGIQFQALLKIIKTIK